MEPNGLMWSQNDTKRVPKAVKIERRNNKMEPTAPKVNPKAINTNQTKTMFRKGRCNDATQISKYSARIAFFADLC